LGALLFVVYLIDRKLKSLSRKRTLLGFRLPAGEMFSF